MRRCIKLSRNAVEQGEKPFASILIKNGEIIAEAINLTEKEKDVTAHAETLALREGQRLLGEDLSDCTLYTNCEPCAMCSFTCRILYVGSVVFAVKSPLMGGFTRWDILDDKHPQTSKLLRGRETKVVAGFMEDEASEVFKELPRALFGLPSRDGEMGVPSFLDD
jgi:tRNA(adenine34) deaminase